MKKICLTIIVVLAVITLSYAESCSDVGTTENKYTAQGDCNYKTQTRTCCEDGNWSDWDEECKVCGEGECWNGSMCEKPQTSLLCKSYKNKWGVVGGSLTRKATCTSNGWSYGEWKGDCQCAEGLRWYKDKMECDCEPGYCWDGGKCEEPQTQILCTDYKHIQTITGGILTRQASCGQGWDYGKWEGTCKCDNGFIWDSEKLDCVEDKDFSAYWKCGGHGRWGRVDCIMRGENIIDGMPCHRVGDYGQHRELISYDDCDMAECECVQSKR